MVAADSEDRFCFVTINLQRHMFKKTLIVLCLSFVLIGHGAFARSGCCSGHSGVCGCSCCDGSRLSTVCLLYYPECEIRTNGDDRSRLSENEKGSNWIDGWELAVVYAVGVSFFLIFAKMGYKIKKSKN